MNLQPIVLKFELFKLIANSYGFHTSLIGTNKSMIARNFHVFFLSRELV